MYAFRYFYWIHPEWNSELQYLTFQWSSKLESVSFLLILSCNSKCNLFFSILTPHVCNSQITLQFSRESFTSNIICTSIHRYTYIHNIHIKNICINNVIFVFLNSQSSGKYKIITLGSCALITNKLHNQEISLSRQYIEHIQRWPNEDL